MFFFLNKVMLNQNDHTLCVGFSAQHNITASGHPVVALDDDAYIGFH